MINLFHFQKETKNPSAKNNDKLLIMKKKYRAGVIGCGRIGSRLEEDPLRGKPCTHAGGYNAHPEVELIAGCDINEKQLECFQRQWGTVKTFTKVRDFLHEEPDIVSIAVWTENHYSVLQEVVKAPSVRVILLEKPIASTVRQGAKILRLCEEKGKQLVIYHTRQWQPVYLQAKKLIREGVLGKIKTIHAHVLSGKPPKLSREKYIGGTFFHDGTHLIDILCSLCGKITKIESVRVKRPWGKAFIETEVLAQMRMKCGAFACVEGSGNRNYFSFQLDIQGTKGRLLLGNDVKKLWLTQKSTRYTNFKELEEQPFDVEPANAHLNCVRNIVDHLNQGTPLLSTGKEALNVLKTITQIYRLGDKE